MARKLQRKSDVRSALIKNQACSLILYEEIKTTLPKAKELKSFIEKVISRSKDSDIRYLRRFFPVNVSRKVINEIIPKSKNINGGYVKLIKISSRLGDNAPMCIGKLNIPKNEKAKRKE